MAASAACRLLNQDRGLSEDACLEGCCDFLWPPLDPWASPAACCGVLLVWGCTGMILKRILQAGTPW